MTPDQIQLVQSSFANVLPIADDAAALFYSRLFEIAPEVKPLFKSDISQQGRKLMATLGVVVNGLTHLEAIVPAAEALAVNHLSYGVKAEHYVPVGEALLWTLGAAVLTGLITLVLYKYLILFATSLVGTWMIYEGTAGYFPSEADSWSWILYVVLLAVFVIVQANGRRNHPDPVEKERQKRRR